MPEEPIAPAFTIDVDLGDNGGKRLYRSIEEVEAWFKAENAFWDWLRQTDWNRHVNQRFNQHFRQFNVALNSAKQGSDLQVNTLGRISAAISDIRKQGGATTDKAVKLSALLKDTYSPAGNAPPKAIHSQHASAALIEEFRRESPVIGASALAYLLRQRTEMTSSDDITAICRVVLYEHGLLNAATSEKTALEGLFSEWTAELSTAKKAFAASQTELSQHQTDEHNRAAQRKGDFDKFMEEAGAGVKQLVETSKKDLADIERTYNEKLALQASVTYWSRKARKHTKLAFAFAALAVAAIGAGAWTLFAALRLLIGDVKVSDVQVWKLGTLLILATVVVWGMRIVVRLLMSNLHLHDDAEERTTMLLTYLALLREGQLPEEVRQLILQALFRPAATGIVRDDAAPPFMAQWLKLTTGSDT